ncbi:hypothetical protein OZX61_02210 [Acinetobacter sp. ESL0695]|uniref:hypothetical protein n=1 Tax=Acinetobacter sp. ESL0695 TaxID=2983215 RepID=UPI0023F23C41|nr:hypothetical protein [Acinetobacter sp. ESL0695]WEV49323.1 hypothetical protein OZX61_02210 [Acinetobacter sp. ESL0695]
MCGGNHVEGSDINIRFGNLNIHQSGKNIKKLDHIANSAPIEKTIITSGNSTAVISEIKSPEEFFQRSGIRSDRDPKAGKPYYSSGSVTISPDGKVLIIPPNKF